MTTRQNQPARSLSAPSISLQAAMALVDAARDAATAIGVEMAVVVTDTAGHLKAF